MELRKADTGTTFGRGSSDSYFRTTQLAEGAMTRGWSYASCEVFTLPSPSAESVFAIA